MRMFNPKRKHFMYSAQSAGIASGTTVNVRVGIHSDSWFNWFGVNGYSIFAAGGAPVNSNIYVNVFDEGTGRSLFSVPQTLESFLPNLSYWSTLTANFYNNPLKPAYFSAPYLSRPSTALIFTINNRNAPADGAATVRIGLIGEKIYDLKTKYVSPGTVFSPFDYVADFGTLAALTQSTITVPIQGDADFDCVKIIATETLLTTALDGVFMTATDLTSNSSLEDTQIPLVLTAGSPNYPFIPTNNIRFRQSSGVNITLNNTTAAAVNNTQVILRGHKVF